MKTCVEDRNLHYFLTLNSIKILPDLNSDDFLMISENRHFVPKIEPKRAGVSIGALKIKQRGGNHWKEHQK